MGRKLTVRQELCTHGVSYCCCCIILSRVQLRVTPMDYIAHQAPLSMAFSRQEYWSGLLFPSLGDLPDPGIKPTSSSLQADSLPLSHLIFSKALLTAWGDWQCPISWMAILCGAQHPFPLLWVTLFSFEDIPNPTHLHVVLVGLT